MLNQLKQKDKAGKLEQNVLEIKEKTKIFTKDSKFDKYLNHKEFSKKGFSALQKILEHSCSRCGLCVAICPSRSIELVETVPKLTGECNNCGLCYQACPRSFYPLSEIKKRFFGTEDNYQDKRLGICIELFTSRSLNNRIFEGSTNGGTTTALLSYLLKNDIIDAVLHMGAKHEDCFICQHPKPIISTNTDEVLKGQHSKQQTSPLLHYLENMSSYEKYAIVGLGCHVEGIRKLQVVADSPYLRNIFPTLAKKAEKLTKNLKFIIGLNCWANPKYGALDKIFKHFNIEEKDIIKFAETAKKGLYQMIHEDKDFYFFASDAIITKDGNTYEFRYGDFLEDTVSMGCNLCRNILLSKEADISIGITASDLKLKEFGYNSVFLRNPDLLPIIDQMVQEKLLLKREMRMNKGKLLRKIAEKMIPTKDVMNQDGFVKNGDWKEGLIYNSSTKKGYSKKLMGLQRFYLMQAIKEKFFLNPGMIALKNNNKFCTDLI